MLDSDRLTLDFRAALARWASQWECPALECVELRFSARLKRSWGRAYPKTGRIVLARALLEHRQLGERVLCHEAAHVAAYREVGCHEPPHGPTWRRLVTAAGHEPELSCGPALPRAVESNSARYLHRCEVCSFTRIARRPVPRWRCADCVTAGLGGELTVSLEAAT